MSDHLKLKVTTTPLPVLCSTCVAHDWFYTRMAIDLEILSLLSISAHLYEVNFFLEMINGFNKSVVSKVNI